MFSLLENVGNGYLLSMVGVSYVKVIEIYMVVGLLEYSDTNIYIFSR